MHAVLRHLLRLNLNLTLTLAFTLAFNLIRCSFRSKKGDLTVHPCSVIWKEKALESRYLIYHEMVKTTKIYVRDATPVSPLMLLLFGGKLEVRDE